MTLNSHFSRPAESDPYVFYLYLDGDEHFFSNSSTLHSRWKRTACTTSSPSVRSWSWKGWQKRQSTLPPRLITKFLSRHLANIFNQKTFFILLFSEDVAQTQTSKNMNKGCSPLLVIIQKSVAKEQWGENVSQKMFLCPEVEFIVYLRNLTRFISNIHNLIRGYTYPRILPRKLHNLFPLSLFPRLEKQSWVAFVPRERKNNVTAVEIWRSWNLRRRSRFTPLPLPPPIALQFEKKKDLRSKIVFKHIYFLHDITDLKGGSWFTCLTDLNLYF